MSLATLLASKPPLALRAAKWAADGFPLAVRKAAPEKWAELCDMQRKVNANPFIGGSPRKVDGTFLRAGEDVGDTP